MLLQLEPSLSGGRRCLPQWTSLFGRCERAGGRKRCRQKVLPVRAAARPATSRKPTGSQSNAAGPARTSPIWQRRAARDNRGRECVCATDRSPRSSSWPLEFCLEKSILRAELTTFVSTGGRTELAVRAWRPQPAKQHCPRGHRADAIRISLASLAAFELLRATARLSQLFCFTTTEPSCVAELQGKQWQALGEAADVLHAEAVRSWALQSSDYDGAASARWRRALNTAAGPMRAPTPTPTAFAAAGALPCSCFHACQFVQRCCHNCGHLPVGGGCCSVGDKCRFGPD